MKLAELVPGHVYRIKAYSTEKYVVFVATTRTEQRRHSWGTTAAISYGLVQHLVIKDLYETPRPDCDDDEAMEAWYEAERVRTVSCMRMTGGLRSPESIRPQEILSHYANSVNAAMARYEQDQITEAEQQAERQAQMERAQQIAAKLREYVGDHAVTNSRHDRVLLTLTTEEAETLYKQLSGED